MSKKFTYFLMLVVMAFIALPTLAQESDFDFEGKSISIGGALATFKPGTWYFLHQARAKGSNAGKGTHSVVGELPTTGGVAYDNGLGVALKKSTLEEIPDQGSAVNKAAYLVRFLADATKEGAYRIQFGTGNYLKAAPGEGTTDEESDAGLYNVYNIKVGGEPTDGHFGINKYNMQNRLDNNGEGYTIVFWDSGELTSLDSNNDWAIHEVIWGDLNAQAEALKELANIYTEYSAYAADDYFTTGNNPGDFDEEAVQAFKDALEAANAESPDFEGDGLSVDEIKALGDTVKAKYDAIWPTVVPINLEEGYYRIRTAVTYYQVDTDAETGEETVTYPDKYMRVNLDVSTLKAVWGTPENLEEDGAALWYVKPTQDGRYDIMNAGWEARFDTIQTSTAATLSTTSTNEMVITPLYTNEDEITYVDINVYPQKHDAHFCLHQGGHGYQEDGEYVGYGKGKSGNVVGWAPGFDRAAKKPKASEWFFEPVDKEEAEEILEAFAPLKDREAMLEAYDSIMTNAKEKLELAIDLQHVKLITNASQLSSPCSDSEEGLHIEYLIDGNASTFWHSDWHNAYQGGTHYVQIEMPEDFEGGEVYATFTRRNNSGNQIKKWGIRGTNNAEATEGECELLYTWETPFNSQTESLTSELFDTKAYKFIRFYFLENSGGSVFAHFAELQMGYYQPNPDAQFAKMGEVGINLQNVINEQKDVERDEITADMYTALKAAYDAFLTKYVDPTILRDTLAAHKALAEDIVNIVKVGDAPGQWSSAEAGTAFKQLYDDAVAYDKAGIYDAETSANYAHQLNADAEALYTLANGIKEGKWYRIQFPTEEMFTTYNWDKVAGNAAVSGGVNTSPALFGKYAGLAYAFKYVSKNNEQKDVDIYEIEPMSADTAGVGRNVYFVDDSYLQTEADKDLTKFRFISVGDSAYMLQNKATGLFLRRTKNSSTNPVILSIQPSLFTTSAIGYGLSVISAKSITGEYEYKLHAQVASNVLVTWEAYTPGSRSGLILEEAEDVANEYDGSEVNIMMKPGEVRGFCFPMEVALKQNPDAVMWSIAKTEGNKITLVKVENQKAIAGRPFIIINGDTTLYQANAAPVAVKVKHNSTISALEPQASGLLRGSFDSETVGAGAIVMSGNGFNVTKSSSDAVGYNSAYIVSEEGFDKKTAVEVVLDKEAEDGIQTVLEKVAKVGAVYTIDGRLVSRRATLNELSRFGKGLYILNGVKVVVK